MPIIWRLIKSRHAATAFDGEGARKYGGRWNSPGVAVAYAADSSALAILEVLVHLQQTKVLPSYSLASADVPDEIVEALREATLPANWRESPVPPETQTVGDAWVNRGAAAVLRVPSAVLPSAANYVLNPAHADFSKIVVRPPEPFEFDPRLISL